MTNNTQQGLADFMRKKLRFDESKRQYYLRACFWNQFVSLESTGSATEQQKAFKRELLLKKAGFAACGLALRQQQIDEARSNFGLIGSE
ncbi:MAG TPA: hypothetical protein ENJ30_02800 [Desulfobulbaceae bacterium]|nr:hypothetical protein [Desulfobulbaceae bacterium]